MRPVNDDDDMVIRSMADVPVKSDCAEGTNGVTEGRNDGDDADERQAPVLEEAGYGYGV
jgi:hypothetical protein